MGATACFTCRWCGRKQVLVAQETEAETATEAEAEVKRGAVTPEQAAKLGWGVTAGGWHCPAHGSSSALPRVVRG
jgi:hypothetical protein